MAPHCSSGDNSSPPSTSATSATASTNPNQAFHYWRVWACNACSFILKHFYQKAEHRANIMHYRFLQCSCISTAWSISTPEQEWTNSSHSLYTQRLSQPPLLMLYAGKCCRATHPTVSLSSQMKGGWPLGHEDQQR